MAGYAIIKLGGKQYVVREGEKLLVDRLDLDENKTFKPDVIFEGGDGKAELLVTSPWGIGILQLSGSTLTAPMMQPNGTRFGGWLLNTGDNEF